MPAGVEVAQQVQAGTHGAVFPLVAHPDIRCRGLIAITICARPDNWPPRTSEVSPMNGSAGTVFAASFMAALKGRRLRGQLAVVSGGDAAGSGPSRPVERSFRPSFCRRRRGGDGALPGPFD